MTVLPTEALGNADLVGVRESNRVCLVKVRDGRKANV